MAWKLKIEGCCVPLFTEEQQEALRVQDPEFFYDIFEEV